MAKRTAGRMTKNLSTATLERLGHIDDRAHRIINKTISDGPFGIASKGQEAKSAVWGRMWKVRIGIIHEIQKRLGDEGFSRWMERPR